MQKKNENKKNKKVVVVAAMALLLALVGISGGETYAKYASNQTDSATATVAKWGYVLSGNANELFGKNYGSAVAGLSPVTNGVGVNVSSSTEKQVLAPGTNGSMTMSLAGKSEVLSKVTTSITVRDIVLKTTGGDQSENYYPLVWTLSVNAINGDSTLTTFTSENYNGNDGNGENVADRINEDINTINTHFNRVALNKEVTYELTLSWKWNFDNGVNDKFDTVFGGLSYTAKNFDENGLALWNKDGSDNDIDYYEYHYDSDTPTTYKDNDSVFVAKVDASITVSQVQD